MTAARRSSRSAAPRSMPEPITLKGEDGAEFRAYLAKPEQATGAGIVILPDVRGLHPFFEELALRYAERGIAALAIDYFGRTAGTGERGDDFDHMPHVDAGALGGAPGRHRGGRRAPARAGSARPLDLHDGLLHGRPTVARCRRRSGWGSRASSRSTAGRSARTGTARRRPPRTRRKIECDVLAIYGEADTGIPQEARDEYDAALDKAGVRHETVVYPARPTASSTDGPSSITRRPTTPGTGRSRSSGGTRWASRSRPRRPSQIDQPRAVHGGTAQGRPTRGLASSPATNRPLCRPSRPTSEHGCAERSASAGRPSRCRLVIRQSGILYRCRVSRLLRPPKPGPRPEPIGQQSSVGRQPHAQSRDEARNGREVQLRGDEPTDDAGQDAVDAGDHGRR